MSRLEDVARELVDHGLAPDETLAFSALLSAPYRVQTNPDAILDLLAVAAEIGTAPLRGGRESAFGRLGKRTRLLWAALLDALRFEDAAWHVRHRLRRDAVTWIHGTLAHLDRVPDLEWKYAADVQFRAANREYRIRVVPWAWGPWREVHEGLEADDAGRLRVLIGEA